MVALIYEKSFAIKKVKIKEHFMFYYMFCTFSYRKLSQILSFVYDGMPNAYALYIVNVAKIKRYLLINAKITQKQ